ncbi:MAG: SOS response-associated peptidase [Solirubrobacteraceae bacterium]|nr:SOS response-associated peptidase [Solirubrobacteraceae bacterium]
MCGRYTLAPGSLTLFSERFGVPNAPEQAAGYNIAPGRPIAAVARRSGAAPSCEMFHWGLIPAWSPAAETRYKMINARVETVREKRSYTDLISGHRCLIPADGFFEWQPQAEGPKRPWWFHLADSELFAFAGLWTSWQPQPGVEPVDSCTMLTTNANETVAPVHNRMPLILRPEDEEAWLDPAVGVEDALGLLENSANALLLTQPVSRAVNSTRNQGEDCIAAVDPSDPEPSSGTLF